MSKDTIVKSAHHLMVNPYHMLLTSSHSLYKQDNPTFDPNSISYNYTFSVFPGDLGHLHFSYKKANRYLQASREEIDLLPMAVRYADIENNVYLIERPPFQIDIDYYPNKRVGAKLASHIPGKKIWIPWTLFFVSMGSSPDHLVCHLYFNDKPLTSLDDQIIRAYTPNLHSDARICFGNSQHTFVQRIDKGDIEYNITNVYNYLFNDYFKQWNPDISVNFVDYFYKYFSDKGIFDKIKLMKKYPKNIDVYNTNWGYHRSWISFLFCLSTLSFEETLSLVSDMKNHLKTNALSNQSFNYSIHTPLKILKKYFNPYVNESPIYSSGSIDDINGPYYGFYKDFKKNAPLLYRSRLFELSINSTFIDFPSNIDHKIFSQEDIYCLLYSHIIDKLNFALEQINNKYSALLNSRITLDDIFYTTPLLQNNRTLIKQDFLSHLNSLFLYNENHITIDYNSYKNFVSNFNNEVSHV